MKPPRLVVVTRRYWPLVGGVPVSLGNLGQALHHLGVHVTVLTPRWQRDWPAELDDRGVRVVRPIAGPRGRFSGMRYGRGLARWLRQHRDRFDAIYVAGLGRELNAALAAAPHAPVLARPESLAEIRRRCSSANRLLFGKWRTATAYVAVSPRLVIELHRTGIDAERIRFLPIGVPIPPPRSKLTKQEARRELAAADPLLAVPTDARLAIFTGELRADNDLETLVTAWREVSHRHPTARLWLVGAGPLRESLARRIRNLDLDASVLLPGRYDSLDDFYQAADLFVQPAMRETPSVSVAEAMAAGLPIVEATGERELGMPFEHGYHVPPANSAALTQGLLALLNDEDHSTQLGQAAYTLARERFCLSAVAAQHVELLQSLVRPS